MTPTSKKPVRVAVYLRVSTADQTVENQRRELADIAAQRGWRLVAEYVDHAISGAKGRDRRPGLDALCRDASRGAFDLVAAWSVDRLGRSVLHLAQTLEEFRAAGVGVYFAKQGLDSTTPTGRAMLGMASVFAEFERELIRERTIAGLARARAAGKRIGRPRALADKTVQRARRQRLAGKSWRDISRAVGAPVTTLRRALG